MYELFEKEELDSEDRLLFVQQSPLLTMQSREKDGKEKCMHCSVAGKQRELGGSHMTDRHIVVPKDVDSIMKHSSLFIVFTIPLPSF